MTKKMTKNEQIETVKDKISKLELGVENTIATRERYQRMVDNFRELHTMKIAGVRKGMLNPEYSHQKEDRFWELQANEMIFRYEDECQTQDGQFKRYEQELAMLNDEIKLLTKELVKMEK